MAYHDCLKHPGQREETVEGGPHACTVHQSFLDSLGDGRVPWRWQWGDSKSALLRNARFRFNMSVYEQRLAASLFVTLMLREMPGNIKEHGWHNIDD